MTSKYLATVVALLSLTSVSVTSAFDIPIKTKNFASIGLQYRREGITKTALGYKTGTSVDATQADNVPQQPEQSQPQQAEQQDLLIGLVLNDEYELTKYIPVASTKCELYEGYRKSDITKQNPIIVKMSHQVNQIELEHQNYMAVAHRLKEDKKHLFVEIYDKIEPQECTNGMAAIVMERGQDNLRFDIRAKGALRGARLKRAMETIICAVGALHEKGMVWTEIKAENFVIQTNGAIKGIDLESVVRYNDYMRMYTAEACPPEFPVQDMYKCLPPIRMDYSFDMWGVGMVLFEIATGKPFYNDGLTNLEYIKAMLSSPQHLVAHRDSKLLSVDQKARNIIKKCLEIDPRERMSCHELLNDPYFGYQPTPAVAHEENAPRPVLMSDFFGCPRPAAPEIIEKTPEPTAEPEFMNQAQRDFIPIALKRLGLPLALEEVLEDAMNVCAKHNPHVAKNLLFNLLESRGNNQIPKNSLNSLLDVIHVCASHDQETAEKLLNILETEIQHRHGTMAVL